MRRRDREMCKIPLSLVLYYISEKGKVFAVYMHVSLKIKIRQ